MQTKPTNYNHMEQWSHWTHGYLLQDNLLIPSSNQVTDSSPWNRILESLLTWLSLQMRSSYCYLPIMASNLHFYVWFPLKLYECRDVFFLICALWFSQGLNQCWALWREDTYKIYIFKHVNICYLDLCVDDQLHGRTGGRKLVPIKELHPSLEKEVCSISLSDCQQARDLIGEFLALADWVLWVCLLCFGLLCLCFFSFLAMQVVSITVFECQQSGGFECNFVFLSHSFWAHPSALQSIKAGNPAFCEPKDLELI